VVLGNDNDAGIAAICAKSIEKEAPD